ncbi:MAG: efflux transporter periplasmic adaptor subunit, partial [Xanthomonadales bacterium]|nr:efflux transporter periplasmic adaptor subunit [Xanthomonadales bacterium]
VSLGYVSGGVAEIRDGLEAGAVVVTLGQAGVREGTKVQVLNPPAEVPGGSAQTAQLAASGERGG